MEEKGIDWCEYERLPIYPSNRLTNIASMVEFIIFYVRL